MNATTAGGAGLIVLLAGVAVGTRPARAEDDRPAHASPGTRTLLERAYAEPGLQTRPPLVRTGDPDAGASVDLDAWRRVLAWLGGAGSVGQVLQPVAIGGAVLLVVLGGLWLLARMDERRARARVDGAETGSLLDEGPLRDAQALAREGRHAEAIRVLLLRTFEMLARRRGARLPPGMTGREAVVRLPLPEDARPALGELVEAVETTLFAGRSTSSADYDRCTARFETLRRAIAQAGT